MTDSLIDQVEDLFISNHVVAAYKRAKLAQTVDPFFGSVDKYVAAFRVHAAARCELPTDEINWYDVMGLDSSVSEEVICHHFCKMGKLIHPDRHCSVAAAGAYSILCNAYEILGNHKSREEFHERSGLKPLLPQPPTKTESHSVAKSFPKVMAKNSSVGLPKSRAEASKKRSLEEKLSDCKNIEKRRRCVDRINRIDFSAF